MNPGLLKHKITIQAPSTTEDELGQQKVSWTDYKTVRCMIKTLQGREYFEAAATQSESNVRFVMRYMSDIDSTMRIIYKGKIYDIVAPPINDDELNKTLTIIAKEKVR